MTSVRVLFLCVANSARSQMAEGLARHLMGEKVSVSSAGSSPTRVNPLAVEVMAEIGIDISPQRSTAAANIPANSVDLVVTLCAEEVCPAILTTAARLHWPLRDPDIKDPSLSHDERLRHFRVARDELKTRILALDKHTRFSESMSSQ
ncbi:MAG: arsenate reductase ArsC [Myxococcota bacterium]|nr:arsenate reductase ArsC [Myxococcota bacterium]